MNTLDTQPDTELAAMLANMTFNADELACLRDDSGEYDEPAGKVTINKEIGLSQDLKLVRRATKRKVMERLIGGSLTVLSHYPWSLAYTLIEILIIALNTTIALHLLSVATGARARFQ